jgi:hypothetical protein
LAIVKKQPASVGTGKPRVSTCSLFYYLSDPSRLVSTRTLRKRFFIAEFQRGLSSCAVSRKVFCWRLITLSGFPLPWRFSLGKTSTDYGNVREEFQTRILNAG